MNAGNFQRRQVSVPADGAAMNPTGPSLLIAGCGYLGMQLARLTSQYGWDVCAITRSESSAQSIMAELGIPVAVADLGDTASLRQARAQLPAVACVVHAASSSRGGLDAYQKVFIDGLANLSAVFAPERLVFTSSTSVYAQTDGSIVDENSPAEGASPTSRLLLEAECLALRQGGTVARLAGLYGPSRSVVLRKFLLGTAVIEEGGTRYLNQIHRDDAATAVLHLLNHPSAPGGIFNVSDNTPLSQRATYEGLARHFQRPLPPEGPKPEGRKRGWSSKRVSNHKLRALGWKPLYPSFLAAVATDDILVTSNLEPELG